ncbi:methyltransferase domain-containing protein [Senegalia massiliensis]|uniref:methyltransferase domain-containing protein n=1 Tax=Senegalia massiliensis TaxID=1720316 RepID=UPI00102FF7FD|nr:methyltransferase domain-containing protein [Senegalia massiliensis]
MLNKLIIENMPYPDFVGLINQWNVLPGAFTTLNKWINHSYIDSSSNILQIACTTGFQVREIAHLTKCSGKAFDLSRYAIESAIKNKKIYSPSANIEYFVQDGLNFKTNEKFTHVIVGGGLKFFSNPRKMVENIISYFDDDGYLLASPFYAIKEVPSEVLDSCKQMFGIDVTHEPYDEVMKLYKDFEILYEDRNQLRFESEEDISYYCDCITRRAVKNLNCEDLYPVIYDRLYKIKEVTNELRKYQEYSVLVLRYRKNIYPERYVELF